MPKQTGHHFCLPIVQHVHPEKTFIVESDHKPLEIIHLKDLASNPTRLQRILLRYDMTIQYCLEKEM